MKLCRSYNRPTWRFGFYRRRIRFYRRSTEFQAGKTPLAGPSRFYRVWCVYTRYSSRTPCILAFSKTGFFFFFYVCYYSGAGVLIRVLVRGPNSFHPSWPRQPALTETTRTESRQQRFKPTDVSKTVCLSCEIASSISFLTNRNITHGCSNISDRH